MDTIYFNAQTHTHIFAHISKGNFKLKTKYVTDVHTFSNTLVNKND